MKNYVHGANPFIEINNSINVDSSYMLKIIEDMLVEIYGAERVSANQFMKKFLGYYNMFFLYLSAFKLMNKVMSMKIPDITYTTIKDKKEMIKAYISAVYKYENGVFISLKQIQFSKILLEYRVNSPFNFRL